MKKGYAAVIVLILIPVLCTFYYISIKSSCNEIAAMIKSVEYDNENSFSMLENAEKKWSSLKKVMAVSSNHSVVEEISRMFIKVKESLRYGNRNMLSENVRLLEKALTEIYFMEKPVFYNIF